MKPNQPVYYQNPEKSKWNKGFIQAKVGERSYIIEGGNNTSYNRNRVNVRERHTKDIPEPEIDPQLLPVEEQPVNDNHKETMNTQNVPDTGINKETK